jgi:hemolysin activation/secretion protein
MTSIIKVDTIQNKAGSTSLAANKLPDMLSGSAKAWVSLNGTGTIALRDSFNIASIADEGTGDYTVNFSSNMSSTNYSGEANRSSNGNSNPNYVVYLHELHIAVGSHRVKTNGATGGAVDSSHIFSCIHGDLA